MKAGIWIELTYKTKVAISQPAVRTPVSNVTVSKQMLGGGLQRDYEMRRTSDYFDKQSVNISVASAPLHLIM